MVSDVVQSLESRVTHGSVDEIKAHIVLEPDLCSCDGPFEKAEFVEAEGRTERPISKGLID